MGEHHLGADEADEGWKSRVELSRIVTKICDSGLSEWVHTFEDPMGLGKRLVLRGEGAPVISGFLWGMDPGAAGPGATGGWNPCAD